MSVVSWLRSTPARRGTPITTSAKLSPPASRTRTERTSLTPGTERAARSTRPATPDGVRSISASMFWRASRSAPRSTIAATKIAASESPAGTPAATSPSPTSTAMVPAKSEPKCHAFAMSAAFRSIRPCRSEIRRPCRVDGQHDQERRERVPGGLDGRGALDQPNDGLDGDPRRGGGQERRLAQRGEVLGLAVAERVLAVGRPLGDADRVQRSGRRPPRRRPSAPPRPGCRGCRSRSPPRASGARGRSPRAATPPRCAARDDMRAVYGRPVSFSPSEVQ